MGSGVGSVGAAGVAAASAGAAGCVAGVVVLCAYKYAGTTTHVVASTAYNQCRQFLESRIMRMAQPPCLPTTIPIGSVETLTPRTLGRTARPAGSHRAPRTN